MSKITYEEALEKAWDLVHNKYPENNEEIQLVRYAIKTAMELTKRIGELESKLIKQEKLLWLYIEYIKELENMNSIYNAEICEHSKHYHIKDGMLNQHYDKTNEILKKIRELKKQ